MNRTQPLLRWDLSKASKHAPCTACINGQQPPVVSDAAARGQTRTWNMPAATLALVTSEDILNHLYDPLMELRQNLLVCLSIAMLIHTCEHASGEAKDVMAGIEPGYLE